MTNWYRTVDRFRDPMGAMRIVQFAAILSRFPSGHLIDLGAGHGTFSRVAAELGWQVTAVDARDERYPDDARVKWVVSDVREFDDYDDADVVCCLGLWYHLTLDDQRQLAHRVAPRPLIVDTHVATQTLPHYQKPLEARLSQILTKDGFTGRLFDEGGLESRPTASWGNRFSFWPSVASLEKQLYEAGYEMFEQVNPPYLPDRAYFVATFLGDHAARTRFESLVTQFNPVVKPDAPAHDRPFNTLAAAVTPPARARPARSASPIDLKPPTVKVAARQLVGALERSVHHRLRHLRRGDISARSTSNSLTKTPHPPG
jgi:SAM-dependent methyltransferase